MKASLQTTTNVLFQRLQLFFKKEVFPIPNPSQNQQQQQQQNQDQAGQQKQIVHLNWSNFKPEFLGKPDEDAEAHLLHSNDWMNAHHFIN